MILILWTVSLLIFLKVSYDWYIFYQRKNKLQWLPNIPGWPIIGFALEFGESSETLATFDRLVKQNGKLIVGHVLTKIELITCDYEFLEFVLGSTTLITKSTFYKFLLNWLGTGLLTSDGTKWKQRRKLITPAFHFSVLKPFITVFEKNVDILLKKLEKEIDKERTDIYPLVTLCALDVICETAMGVTVEAQKYANSKYVKNVKKMCRIGVERGASLIKTSDLLYLLTPDYYQERQAIKELHAVTNNIIESRMNKLKDASNVKLNEDDIGRKDKLTFLDILLKSTVDGKPLSQEDISEEVNTFMFEGHDTISSAMSFALYLLSTHPEVQNRALEEQKQIFADDITRPVTYDDLQEMKYLECIIKETLRLYPSVPLFGRKVTEDITYKGNVIPKDTNITIFCYGILRDPEHYPNPDVFNPDRFETIDGKKPYSFIPFSAGPRNCIGQKFAILEIKTTLSKILRNFELLPATNEEEMILLSEAVLKSKNGVNLKVTKRKL